MKPDTETPANRGTNFHRDAMRTRRARLAQMGLIMRSMGLSSSASLAVANNLSLLLLLLSSSRHRLFVAAAAELQLSARKSTGTIAGRTRGRSQTGAQHTLVIHHTTRIHIHSRDDRNGNAEAVSMSARLLGIR